MDVSELKVEVDKENEEDYTEPVKYGFSEIVKKANWGVLVFYSGLAVISTILLLILGAMLGTPLLYVFLFFMVVVVVLSFLNARAYGWIGDIITEGCEFVGFKRVFLKFSDGREKMNEGILYWDTTIGEDGFIPFSKVRKYLEYADIEKITELSKKTRHLGGGIMKLHLKSNYGRECSTIMLIHLPRHILDIKTSILPLLVVKTERKMMANNKEWLTLVGVFYNPISVSGEDQFKFLKEAPRIAKLIVDLVESDALRADNEALRLKINAQDKLVSKLLQVREDIKMGDKALEESGGTPKKWYEIAVIRIFLELIIITGLALSVIFVTGVVT